MGEAEETPVAYGGSLVQKLRPGHVAKVIANETRMAFAPVIIPRLALSKKSFLLWGDQTNYFLHKYNTTWRNERAVELSAVERFLKENPHGSFMEFGNVLGHYSLGKPDVIVDLYEKGERVSNVDIVDYPVDKTFERIVSVSTIEHVGWDEEPRSAQKVEQALSRLLALLAPGGKLFITAPTGHNPYLDDLVRHGLPNVIREAFFVRNRFEWTQRDEFTALPYGSLGPGAASVWLAEIGSATSSVGQF
jgi:SAM-dependent methyltransferase